MDKMIELSADEKSAQVFAMIQSGEFDKKVSEIKNKDMWKFGKALEVIELAGGDYRGGVSWDTTSFHGTYHKEVSSKVFEVVGDLIGSYNLSQVDAWEDEHNSIEAHSSFNTR